MSLLPALAGALALGLVEMAALHAPSAALAGVVLALFLALGLAIAGALAAGDAVCARARLRGLRAAAARSAPALIVLVPLLRHAFDGPRASALPGAASAFVWLPALALAGLVASVHAGTRLVGDSVRARRATAAALFVLALAFDVAGRRVAPSGYPDLHLLVAVSAVAAAAVSARIGLRWPRVSAARAAVLACAIGLAFAAALHGGLADGHDRWILATRGTDARLIVRALRERIDLDGDGYSAVLGGPDCNDRDPRVHPLAPDAPGDGVDQDCDGTDARLRALAPAAASASSAAQHAPSPELRAWREDGAVTALLASTRRENVLLITVDALRADALDGADARRDAPALAGLVDESAAFAHAYSTSSSTDVAIPGLLTGRVDPFDDATTTLGARMRASGRATHAVLPTETLRWAGEAFLADGMDGVSRVVNDAHKEDVGSACTSDETTDRGLAFLDRADGPWFLWVHYFDVHEHLEIPDDDPALVRVAGTGRLSLAAKYRALVRVVDHAVGRLVAELRSRGLWDHTIVVFAADHGEALGEDPRLPLTHTEYVYEPLVHVPLAVRVPGVAPRVVREPVSVVDVLPTACDLAGVEAPVTDGCSLLPLVVAGDHPGPPPPERNLVIGASRQLGVIAWPWKLMMRPEDNLVELYDLSQDPAEQHDLAPWQPERLAALTAACRDAPQVRLDRTPEGRRERERRVHALLSR